MLKNEIINKNCLVKIFVSNKKEIPVYIKSFTDGFYLDFIDEKVEIRKYGFKWSALIFKEDSLYITPEFRLLEDLIKAI